MNVDTRGCNIVGDAANEPSIAVSATDPRKIVIGWRQFDTVASDFRQAGYGYSHDGGHTWVFPGALNPGEPRSDPVLDTGPDGTIYFLSFGIDVVPTLLFPSFDGGSTWAAPALVTPGLADKPWMAVDRTDGVGRGNIYIAGIGGFFRSTDGGGSLEHFYQTFGGVVPTLTVSRDGALFVVDEGSKVSVSTNAQDPHSTPTFSYLGHAGLGGSGQTGEEPNPCGLFGQTWVATDHSPGPTRGNVYLFASVYVPGDDPLDVRFTRSTDGGRTWSAPIRVNDDPPGGGYQWFGMMSVAPNGRIDAVWNDTCNSGQGNLSELFYSYSADAGDSWSKNVPVSPMFDSWVGWPGGQCKIGDYYHMVSDNLGVNVAYAATFNGEEDVYFLRIGPWDCNGNEIPDEDDIASGASRDCNANGVPDECEYRVDLDGDGLTTLSDFAAFQRALTGPGAVNLLAPCDALLDPDHDDDIDLHDFYLFQHVFVSP